jgi:ornithine cyclodeaminase
MEILDKEKILQRFYAISKEEQVAAIAKAFVSYSDGSANIPPVGHLKMDTPPGDVHIKYGAIKGNSNYVIKIASGFYENPSLGLPSSNGMMLAFNSNTGQPNSILLDEGFLTDVRTGLAGAVCAKYVGPKTVTQIGIVGTGIQSRYQLRCLKAVTSCIKVKVWGRDAKKSLAYKTEMETEGYSVEIARDLGNLVKTCNLIVTTTPATEPLIRGEWILPGTHITAVGSDTPGKREMEKGVLEKADHIIADSISQCTTQGELQYEAYADVIELGDWIAGKRDRKESDITVCDLTGVAVQDIVITNMVMGS